MESILSLGGILVPISAILAAFLFVGTVAIAAMVLKHRERIAKIERGIDPDGPWPRR